MKMEKNKERMKEGKRINKQKCKKNKSMREKRKRRQEGNENEKIN